MTLRKILPVAAMLFSLAATRAHDAPGYRGTWTAEFKGTVYCRLIIDDGSPMGGTLALGDVHADGDGNLVDVSDAPSRSRKIENVSVGDGALVFEVEDGSDRDFIEFRITGDDTAEMRFRNIPPDQKLKPLHLNASK